jgi:hypothetical protein
MSKSKLIIVFLLFVELVQSQNPMSDNYDFYNSTTKWFKAWELVSKKTYGLKTLKPTDFVLFDEKFIYTTSKIVGKGGQIVLGPKNLLDKNFTWYKKEYTDSISLPDGQKRKADLMCFAIPIYNSKDLNGYFVMPLISYWQRKNPGDHRIGYEKLTTGVFVHEFCHSQQFENGMNGMEQGAFDKYFSAHENEVYMDDIMQDIYAKDSIYTKMFEKELDLFITAYSGKTKNEILQLAQIALDSMTKRQKFILDRDNRDLAEIDNYWLTMEGVAQFSSFAWLTNKKGGKLTKKEALEALKTSSWSQEEGFAIAYAYSKLFEPKIWAEKMFRSKTVNIIELLKNETKRQ